MKTEVENTTEQEEAAAKMLIGWFFKSLVQLR